MNIVTKGWNICLAKSCPESGNSFYYLRENKVMNTGARTVERTTTRVHTFTLTCMDDYCYKTHIFTLFVNTNLQTIKINCKLCLLPWA